MMCICMCICVYIYIYIYRIAREARAGGATAAFFGRRRSRLRRARSALEPERVGGRL